MKWGRDVKEQLERARIAVLFVRISSRMTSWHALSALPTGGALAGRDTCLPHLTAAYASVAHSRARCTRANLVRNECSLCDMNAEEESIAVQPKCRLLAQVVSRRLITTALMVDLCTATLVGRVGARAPSTAEAVCHRAGLSSSLL